MDKELIKALSKYPFIIENDFIDSIELKQNKTCVEKCNEKDCLKLTESNNNLEEYICSKGYNNILSIVGEIKFIINGLIFQDNKSVPNGRKDVRKEWQINRNEVVLFSKKIQEIELYLEKRINETTEKNFSMFHDFKTSMSIFYTCTQDIINNLEGNTFTEKLENSDKSYKDLYNSLDLITSQLGMVDVILNPNSIQFGKKKPINLYKLFDKIKALFEHLSTKKRDVNIKLSSEIRVDDCYCYESIEFIPLILLDNALKYSVSGSDIDIKFEQHYGVLKVIVKNIGPLVNDQNKENIFEKFFRDESGKKFSKEGMGMGLWIANQILEAHNCKLEYHKNPRENGPIGLNIFEFELPISKN
ncbi:sensor histidine kinase [Flavobacterium terrigena]|uniref:histidine kinase n=1 Tax=Flavobacterium terrigena TaxID=402734 RepID=A0A1H6U6B9_9FLAO|nr:sensor histidine kinase [Flavobacterium terrigena]SEI87889.1 Histidine kinase-, DNA gyrase B-, and HSP90-like ATPase [Flavobacterium terrigena]